ncbi:hypothetical protein [Rhizobium sp. BE258]|uniref:hypothetical protein n=1 Tax=Rhizobium sp. BE258 TaxID=2817722 RepID=UPI002859B269|nr:hypothetical protein [Rhizobium sp. BE258]MDR7146180.1 hypothetical protein [Rhizobium sp. BE258]
MQTDHNANGGRGASVVSRRKLFQIAAASAAATLPVAASAAVAEKTFRLPQPTDEQQLENCVAQLRDILQRMHPTTKLHPEFYSARQDGSFRFCLQGDVTFQPFDGDGIYLVSVDGSIWEYLVREEPVISLAGNSLGYSHYFGRARCDDGGWDDFERWVTNFVRKVGEVPTWTE